MNELASEKSPYLLQHAQNPVHWKAWSSQSLEIAKNEMKPLFVSIGYSTCHWCHVMEHESFENQEIANYLNQNFVCIKIDREEHPDVDSIYMNAIQLMTGRGGWPLNVFLDMDLKPFYGGTYFRPEMFLNLLQKIHSAWLSDRAALTAQGDHVFKHLQQMQSESMLGSLPKLPLENYFKIFASNYDRSNGGKLGAPKFPLSYDLVLLSKLEDPAAKAMLRQTIAKMARGGIYDHLEGGLHRYATDDEWKVPHFEKMLYDQSAFVEACLADYRANHDEESLFVAQKTIDYVLDRLQTKDGGFYSAEDADSEGVEGKFYRWDDGEIRDLAGSDAASFLRTLDWPMGGNFEGHFVLHMETTQDLPSWHRDHASTLSALRKYRAKRARPITDTKVLTAWNGLFLSALARYMQVSGNRSPKYMQALQHTVHFLKQNLFDQASGELHRRWADGESKYRGTLADYSFLIAGLIDTFCLIPSPALSEWIENLQKKQEELFSDGDRGLYWSTPHNESNLLIREKETYDNVEPSANSVALRNVCQWYALTGNEIYLQRQQTLCAALPESLVTRPNGFPVLIDAALSVENGLSTYFVVSGDERLLSTTSRKLFHDTTQAQLVVEINLNQHDLSKIVWIRDKISSVHQFALYHCKNQSCDTPILDATQI